MVWTKSRRPQAVMAAVLSALAIAATGVVARPAAAAVPTNILYPSGCRQVTVDYWQASCWAGYNYARFSVAVLGVQFVLKGSGFNPGPTDCDFGLTTDGIVGGNTWSSLRSRVSAAGISDAWGAYYNVGIDGVRFYWQFASTGSWFVRNPHYGNQYVAVASYTNQSADIFCP